MADKEFDDIKLNISNKLIRLIEQNPENTAQTELLKSYINTIQDVKNINELFQLYKAIVSLVTLLQNLNDSANVALAIVASTIQINLPDAYKLSAAGISRSQPVSDIFTQASEQGESRTATPATPRKDDGRIQLDGKPQYGSDDEDTGFRPT